MRRSGAAVAALVSVPVLLAAGSAVALDITFDQVTASGGAAVLGVVGGPGAGFVGSLLGRQIGLKLHPRARPIDLTDLKSRAHVTPISEGPIIDAEHRSAPAGGHLIEVDVDRHGRACGQ